MYIMSEKREAEEEKDSILTPVLNFFLCFKVPAAAGKL